MYNKYKSVEKEIHRKIIEQKELIDRIENPWCYMKTGKSTKGVFDNFHFK